MSSTPVRTCIGCRKTDSQDNLVKVVARTTDPHDDGAVVLVVDARRLLPGRGAWLHAKPRCFEQAHKKRAFGRALKIQAAIDVHHVQQWFATESVEGASPNSKAEVAARPERSDR